MFNKQIPLKVGEKYWWVLVYPCAEPVVITAIKKYLFGLVVVIKLVHNDNSKFTVVGYREYEWVERYEY